MIATHRKTRNDIYEFDVANVDVVVDDDDDYDDDDDDDNAIDLSLTNSNCITYIRSISIGQHPKKAENRFSKTDRYHINQLNLNYDNTWITET
ncbi:hypothetical protein BLOT_013072 [Blomia tropicalis]|nr:hypothetical protein BLOT_013072 [Blomia tropicalis]